MKYLSTATFAFVILVSACSPSKNKQQNSSKTFQAISALGDTLYAPPASAEHSSEFQHAKQSYDAYPDSTKMVIAYANLAEGQKQYRQAIDIYSKGIQNHPENERLYRKRGQAYIITRQFDKAVNDLMKVAYLMNSTKNPNSMLPTDAWLQLGLARYMQGHFQEAAKAFQKSLDRAPASNMRVKSSYWLYMSLRRAGRDLQAGEVLKPITADMNITEKETYLKLLLVFKGNFDEKSLLNDADSPQDNVIIAYGLGNWHYINGRKDHAKELFRNVYNEKDQWDKMGYIAAETDLARLGFLMK